MEVFTQRHAEKTGDPKERLRSLARILGFQVFGVASAVRQEDDIERLSEWLARGDAARMRSYMSDERERRGDPGRLVEGARSVIVVGMSYAQEPPDPRSLSGQPEGRAARFAAAADYHEVLAPRLDEMARFLASIAPPPVVSRAFVDTGPLLERAFARRAGLGFIGKNACLIHPRHGSWFVLGAVVTTAELPADTPAPEAGNPDGNPGEDPCGDCRRCLDACPTGALYSPRRLDARKCLSYLSIETHGSLLGDTMRAMGTSLFGCDLCQEVCPFNRAPLPCAEPAMHPGARLERLQGWNATLDAILRISSNRDFERIFEGSPLLRARRGGLLRNAAIVAGNLKRRDLMRLLHEIAERKHESPAVREAAVWALSEIEGESVDQENIAAT